ncbi:hypothetical protein AB3N02_21895 [Priestia aryabhattai]|uniref:hypothetical protein n=1 Tax=Priestia aryabhattai TaxID=412384 RepID=UPI0039A3A3DA
MALTEVQIQVLQNQEKALQNNEQSLKNQAEILANQREILKQDGFWEHLTDHIIIGTAFFFLGAMVFAWFMMRLLNKRIRVDHELDKGVIMRVIDDESKKKWLIVNPANTWQFFDIILLSFFDKGKDKFIEMQDTKRIRIIRRVIVVLLIMLIWSGVALILSASKINMDALYYLRLLFK